jgi:hypothetical protein
MRAPYSPKVRASARKEEIRPCPHIKAALASSCKFLPSTKTNNATTTMASHSRQISDDSVSEDDGSDFDFSGLLTIKHQRRARQARQQQQQQREMLRPRVPGAMQPPPPYTHADQTIRELRQLTTLQEKTIADYKEAMREMHRFYYRVLLISLLFGLLVGMRSQVRLVPLFRK